MKLIQQESETVMAKKSIILGSFRSRGGKEDGTTPTVSHETATTRFRKISDMAMLASKESDTQRSSVQPSTTDSRQGESEWQSHLPRRVAVAVSSDQGETLELKTKVQ